MLSLLPEQTLHILDEAAANAMWLEPWRELARTITFNAKHVFVSRRLVRVLKGKGRLAVYLPDTIEPDTKAFRLFRAIARIAVQADAKIVPVFVSGGRYLPFSLTPKERAPRRWFRKQSITALEPMTIAQLIERAGEAVDDHSVERARSTGSPKHGSQAPAPVAACSRRCATRPACSVRRRRSSRMWSPAR